MEQDDLKNLLDDVPHEIIHYILQHLDNEIILVVSFVSSRIRALIEKIFPLIICLRVAWLRYSATHGFIHLMKWSNRIDTHLNDQDTMELIIRQYLIQDKPIIKGLPFRVMRFAMLVHAAKKGHLEAIKWIHNNGGDWTSIDWSDVLYWTIENEHLHVLQWIHKNHPMPTNIGTKLVHVVIRDNTNILQWAIANDYQLNNNILREACIFNAINVLTLMRNSYPRWDSTICYNIAKELGRPNIVKWLNNETD